MENVNKGASGRKEEELGEFAKLIQKHVKPMKTSLTTSHDAMLGGTLARSGEKKFACYRRKERSGRRRERKDC